MLNSDQEKALKEIKSWWTSNQMYHILGGRAGTGKTYLVNEILKTLSGTTPLILAPTNEALYQLQSKISGEFAFKTIHSALGIRPNTDCKDLVFEQINFPTFWATETPNILIIDEASMIDEYMLELLMKLKIPCLFLGHKSQLPPPNSSDKFCNSPVFRKEWNESELKIPMRNTGELWEFNNYLESLIYKKRPFVNKRFHVSESDTQAFLKSDEGKMQLLSGKLKLVFWTNKTVDEVNAAIRRLLFREKAKETKYYPRDMIIFTEPYFITTDLHKFNEQVFTEKQKEKNPEYFHTNTKGVVIDYSKVVLRAFKPHEFELYKVTLEINGVHRVIYDFVSESDRVILNRLLERRAYAMRYPEQKAKAFQKKHFILSCFANIKHFYAATAHRLQGASINSVIVGAKDILSNPRYIERHKCLYVACSRAEERLMITL